MSNFGARLKKTAKKAPANSAEALSKLPMVSVMGLLRLMITNGIILAVIARLPAVAAVMVSFSRWRQGEDANRGCPLWGGTS